MGYSFWGLPGGSSKEGPTTLVGLLFVAIVTALVVVALVAALFYAVEQINQQPQRMPLVESFALRHNA